MSLVLIWRGKEGGNKDSGNYDNILEKQPLFNQ